MTAGDSEHVRPGRVRILLLIGSVLLSLLAVHGIVALASPAAANEHSATAAIVSTTTVADTGTDTTSSIVDHSLPHQTRTDDLPTTHSAPRTAESATCVPLTPHHSVATAHCGDLTSATSDAYLVLPPNWITTGETRLEPRRVDHEPTREPLTLVELGISRT